MSLHKGLGNRELSVGIVGVGNLCATTTSTSEETTAHSSKDVSEQRMVLRERWPSTSAVTSSLSLTLEELLQLVSVSILGLALLPLMFLHFRTKTLGQSGDGSFVQLAHHLVSEVGVDRRGKHRCNIHLRGPRRLLLGLGLNSEILVP